jgi:hypothetical protein
MLIRRESSGPVGKDLMEKRGLVLAKVLFLIISVYQRGPRGSNQSV